MIMTRQDDLTLSLVLSLQCESVALINNNLEAEWTALAGPSASASRQIGWRNSAKIPRKYRLQQQLQLCCRQPRFRNPAREV